MNNKNIRLFEELVISEYDLSQIISNYHFPRPHYEKEMKRLREEIPMDDRDFKNKILLLKDKIKFRTKNIIFIGYSCEKNDQYYFFQLTTKKSDIRKQSIYFKHIKGHTVYINTFKIYYFNFKVQKVWSSKFNTNKENITQDRYWKSNMLNKIPRKVLESLSKKTNIKIYKQKLEEYEMFEKVDFNI